MKVLAHSIQVPATPYVHLGYTAATQRIADPKAMDALRTMAVLGISLAVLALLGLIMSRFKRGMCRTASLLMAVAALILLVTAYTRVGIAYDRGRDVPTHPAFYTNSRIRLVLEKVTDRVKGGSESISLPDLERELADLLRDGWETPMKLELSTAAGERTCTVVSAGPDRQFGTSDDLRVGQSLDLLIRK